MLEEKCKGIPGKMNVSRMKTLKEMRTTTIANQALRTNLSLKCVYSSI
jgi:hypothetical protein